MKEAFKKYFTNVWNVPNVLTMLRLALIPVFIVLYVNGYDKLALMTFLVASFTDFLDGFIARKYNLVTNFGKLMDPLADKLMVCTALLCQAIYGIFPWAAIAIVLVKELAMIVGGVYMLEHDIVVYSNMLGKSAQVSFIAALILSFFHVEFVAWQLPVDTVVLWISVALALAALIDYAVGAYKQLKGKGKQ